MLEKKLVELAYETLSEEESNELPSFYLPLLRQHIQDFPTETNFIVELADPGKKNTGGNGFGVVTCMESFCWKDIPLDADPTRPDGGKKDGFGSFWLFQTHCDDPQHIKGRNERLAKTGFPPPPAKGALERFQQSSTPSRPSASGPSRLPDTTEDTFMPALFPSSNIPDTKPGPSNRDLPSKVASSSSSRSAIPPPAQLSFTSSSQPSGRKSILRALSDHNFPNPETDRKPDTHDDRKPYASFYGNGKGKENAIYILSDDDDDDDDEVIPLQASQVPQDLRRAPTNKHAPIALSDDEDARMPSSPASRSSHAGPSSSQPSNPLLENMKRMRERRLQRQKALDHLETTSAKREDKPSLPIPGGSLDDQLHALIAPQQPTTYVPLSPDMATIIRQARVRQIAKEREMIIQMYLRHASQPHSEVLRDARERLHLLTQWVGMDGTAEWVEPSLALRMDDPGYARIVQSWKVFEDGWREKHGAAALYSQQYAGTVPNLYAPYPANAMAGPSNGLYPKFEPGFGGYPGMPGAFPGEDPLDMEERGEEWDRPRGLAELQEFFAKGLDDFQEDKDIDEGLKKLNLTSLDDKLPGMAITLMPHQVLGVAFMLSKERDVKFKGGLMCDAMGLGKTVQTIGVMVANPPTGRTKTTLVIAPLALLGQWKAEIENKAPGMFEVLIYHGAGRKKDIKVLKKDYDVILTTYGTLTAEFGKDEKKKKKKRDARADSFVSEDEAGAEVVVRKKGPLFKIDWYRIVLDEAHIVRNRNTRAAKAVIDLEGVYKWSLTGTLIVNGLDDVYTQLRFVGTTPLSDWGEFRTRISGVQKRKPRLATRRLQVVLKQCMIRRNKDSTLNGKRLLELPPKDTIVDELDFTMEERQIYRAVEERAKVRFCKYLKAGTVLKHYSVVLVLLLRLRQLTCHPYLLRRDPNDPNTHDQDLRVDDAELHANITAPRMDDIGEIARAVTMLGQEWVGKVRKQLNERQDRMVKAEKTGDEEAAELESCSICLDGMENEMVTVCQHTFCHGCLDEIFKAPARDNDLTDEQTQRGCRKCPLCRQIVNPGEIFRAAAFEENVENEEEDEDDMAEEDIGLGNFVKSEGVKLEGKRCASGSRGASPARKMRRLKGKGKARADEIYELDSEDEEDLNDLEAVLPSTKMRYMGDLVTQYLDEDSTSKIIIFSQFVQYIDLCAIFLGRKGVRYEKYVGSMKQPDREVAVQRFTNAGEGSPRVMIISLKCGGVGLNLTAANRVICLDLAWNAATENQAVDRAHRIGQTKAVEVRRLIVRDTVEQRILALQESKEAMANGAMGEGGAVKVGRLSVRDLIKLFGVDEDPE